ncbi:hypothetical protein BKK56_02630 [Rodentibacter genomosp. 2]|nr:hypothetical protein BKK56_02630 [Rodentibacter genomosp. 2]
MSFSAFANNLELTENGILSSIDNKIISKNITKIESVSYDLYFSNNKILGDLLVFESNSQYDHICYIPISKKQNKFFIRTPFCLDKYINFDSEGWEVNSYSSDHDVELSDVTNDDIIDIGKTKLFKLTSRSNGEIYNNTILFKNLIYKIGNDEVNIDYIFKLHDGKPDLRLDSLKFCFHLIKDKTYLYNKPSDKAKSKMYLIRNDKICILDKNSIGQEDWYFINYKGKKN